jgi:3-oxoacyl-[acyl-carrier protein] reductase
MSRPVQRFDGQIAIVSGAASGIGNQIARDLVARGAEVFGVDIQAEALREVPEVTSLPCDLADTDAYRALLSSVEHDYGRVDILANVAGIDEPVSAVGADTAFYRRILRNSQDLWMGF